MTITVTAAAAKHIQEILHRNPGAVGLRFGVKPSGCAEYSYVVDVARAVEEGDQVFDSNGVHVVVATKALDKIGDTEIDFKKAGLNSNLIFNNPWASSACGCGESFSVK
jgi:iron-sulfur cluster assembly protein